MKKLIAIVLVLNVFVGLVFAKLVSVDPYAVDASPERVQPTAVVSVEQAIEQKLADAIAAAQLNRDVESELRNIKRDMDAELESVLMTRLDNIELAR